MDSCDEMMTFWEICHCICLSDLLLPAELLRSGNLPVLFLLISQKSTFCTQRKKYELDLKMDDIF